MTDQRPLAFSTTDSPSDDQLLAVDAGLDRHNHAAALSYQAPEFYRRHEYTVLAEIEGYPNGIVKYLMHKSLGAR